MNIKVNENWECVDKESTLFYIKEKYHKDSDVCILNGYPINDDKKLKDKDEVVFIKKGQIPTMDELESLLVARHTPGVHSKVKKAVIGIAGLGGLGSNIAISLARVGVGKLVIVDFDVVEPSNLNRQQYFIKDIGKYKVHALKEILLNINPFIEIEEKVELIREDNIQSLFKDVDIIIEAFDNPISKASLSTKVLTSMREKYLIASSGMAGYYDSNLIKTRKINSKFYICGDEENEAKEGQGLMATRVSICANHMANIAIRIILGEEGEIDNG
ncbi:MAG: sulfur carrier protein ThiS adenylyltransferase ThiF [Peptostreptococcaceae bacterium]